MSVLAEHAATGLVAVLVTLVTTPVVRTVASRLSIVSRPGGRHVHANPVPRLGGVAIFLGLVAAVGIRLLGEFVWGWQPALTKPGTPLLGVIGGATAIFAVGVLDDVLELRPVMKLAGQVVAATLVYAAGIRVDFIGDPFGGGLFLLGVLSYPVTLLWLVGFANVINLIDGLDGLAAGVSAIAAVSLALLAQQSNHGLAAAIAVGIAGACIGFLRYNFHPASIFMGDSGSLLLGFLLGSAALVGVMKSVAAIALVVPLLVIGVPVFDTFSAIVRRSRHGRPIQEADLGHVHHRLLGRGFDQRQTVLIIYVWSIALAFGGYAMRWLPALYKLLTFAVLATLSGLMAYWLGLFEAAHHDDE